MELIYLLLIFPAASFPVGLAFAAGAVVRKRKVPAIVGAIWLLYGVYEILMYTRVLCSGECNIRVDLLLIYPILLLATLTGIISLLRKGPRGD